MTNRTPSAPLPPDTRLNIAEYTLGTLYGPEEVQVRELINSNDEAVHLALHWETVLLAMADRLPPATPDPLILARVQRTLGLPRLDPEVQPLWRPEAPPQSQNPISTPSHNTTSGAARNATSAPSRSPSPASTATLQSIDPAARTRQPQAASSRRAEPAFSGPDTHHIATTGSARPGHDSPSSLPDKPQAQPDSHAVSTTHGPDIGHHPQAQQPAWYARPIGWLALGVLAGIAVLAYTALRPGLTSNPPHTSVQQATPKPPELLSIAILQPPNSSSSPGWVITQTGQRHLRAEPRLQSNKTAEQGLALWTRATNSPDTRFLGWLDDTAVNTLSLPDGVALDENTLFEITLEKQGIDTARAPEGVVLFIGQGVKTVMPDPEALSLQPAPTAAHQAPPR